MSNALTLGLGDASGVLHLLGQTQRVLLLKVAVPSSARVVAFEYRAVNDAQLLGLGSDPPCYATKIIFGEIPVDNVLHLRILVPIVHAAVGRAIPLPVDAFFD
jgi:hypothetical protein